MLRAVEGAEGAVFGAEVGVVDVAVDDVGDHALGVETTADGVCFHADADEVVTVEAIRELFAASSHRAILLCGLVMRVDENEQEDYGTEQNESNT